MQVKELILLILYTEQPKVRGYHHLESRKVQTFTIINIYTHDQIPSSKNRRKCENVQNKIIRAKV